MFCLPQNMRSWTQFRQVLWCLITRIAFSPGSSSTFLLSIWNLKGMVFIFLIYTNILFTITQVFFRRYIAVLFSFWTLNRITLRRQQSKLSQYAPINSSIIYPWPSSKITSICLVFVIAACHSWYWFLTKSISTTISKYQRLGSLYLCCAVLSRSVFVCDPMAYGQLSPPCVLTWQDGWASPLGPPF